MSLPIPPPDKGTPPDNPGGNWYTVTGEQAEMEIAAFGGMSAKLAETVERINAKLTETAEMQRRLTFVPRVDMRGITCQARRPVGRPRERREQRHTARSTSSGDSGDPESEPPRRRGELRHISLPLSAELNRLRAPGGA
jgi:hypothetical protein